MKEEKIVSLGSDDGQEVYETTKAILTGDEEKVGGFRDALKDLRGLGSPDPDDFEFHSKDDFRGTPLEGLEFKTVEDVLAGDNWCE